ncbi:Flagellar hook-associated protein 1 [Phycisphaerae bacterium RAS1]|nr:Flagellar hook-associated protein 1 [Phycisphaerae bacterium RAS1]
MAIFGTSFQIGRSALAAYQSAISVAGQNIANVGNPDYARQTGRLSALAAGASVAGWAPGAGVNMSALQRHVDEALEGQLRLALGNRRGSSALYQTLSQVETLYNELTDQDLSTGFNELFASFSTLQTQPQDATSRNLTIAAADRIAGELHRLNKGILQQISDLNDSAEAAVSRINGISKEIAKLNEKIVAADAQGQAGGNPLRDRRDGLLRELSEYLDVTVREQEGGSINVFVGGDPLITFDRPRELTTQRELKNGVEIASVRFADDGAPVLPRAGQLEAILTARDTHLAGQLDQLDTLAKGLIYEVNRVHSSGRGLIGYGALTSNYAVDDPAAVLNSTNAGLPFPLQNGTFIVHVRNQATGTEVTRQIRVDLDGVGSDSTLNSLAAALSGVPGLTASVTSDNRLQISAAAGSEVSFSEDSSGALAALGLATFFDGVNAADIAVDARVQADPRLLAASGNGQIGDGGNAGRLALLGEMASSLLGNQSVQDFHGAMVNSVSVAAAGALTGTEAAEAVYSGLIAQREAISGVSLDEEAINLTKFERSYQGAARFLTVVENLTDEVLALVGS